MFCSLCGDHARHPKSPEVDLRRKECPRFPGGVIHRGCCQKEVCSDLDARGHVRCGWELGGKERYLASLIDAERGAASRRGPERAAPAR
jgi:hypothetical protein